MAERVPWPRSTRFHRARIETDPPRETCTNPGCDAPLVVARLPNGELRCSRCMSVFTTPLAGLICFIEEIAGPG